MTISSTESGWDNLLEQIYGRPFFFVRKMTYTDHRPTHGEFSVGGWILGRSTIENILSRKWRQSGGRYVLNAVRWAQHRHLREHIYYGYFPWETTMDFHSYLSLIGGWQQVVLAVFRKVIQSTVGISQCHWHHETWWFFMGFSRQTWWFDRDLCM